MNDKKVERMKNVPPFVKFVCANVPMVFDDSLSYYEALCALWKYVQDCVDVINNNALLEEEYIAKFEELKTFVDTYFDNLDVQDEINNKLDEMAESGELEAIISNYLVNGKGRVFYIFPNATRYTSEYNIIQTFNTNLMIDCGHYNEYLNLKESLASRNITHIENLIITHFHGDHVGNFTALVNDGYIDSDTTIYLPHYSVETWEDNSSYHHYLDVMNTITTNNLTYTTPTENQIITLDNNLTCEFFNTNDTYFIDNNLSDDYNDASLILLIKHFNINSLFTGDCKELPINKAYDTGRIPDTLHIYKMGHHGIDTSSHSNNLVTNYCNIENTVEIIGMEDVSLGKISATGGSFTLAQISDIYLSAYNKDNIVFNSFNDLIGLVNGIKGGNDNSNFLIKKIYVSPNSNLIQNGSQEYPYSNLNQAIGHSVKNTGFDYEIHVASGTYSSWLPTSYDCKCSMSNIVNTIHIIGDSEDRPVLEYCLEMFNASNIIVENIIIDNTTKNRGFNIDASNVTLKNVKYTMSDETLQKQRAISALNNSHVIISGAVIENASYGIRGEHSNLDIDNVTFEGVSNACLYFNGGNISSISNITVSDSSTIYQTGTEKPNFLSGFELLSGSYKYSDNSHVIPLLFSAKNFKYVEIHYSISSNNMSVRHKVLDADNNIQLNATHIASSGATYWSASRISLTDSAYCNYAYSRQLERASGGTFTMHDNVDTFTINSIKGY